MAWPSARSKTFANGGTGTPADFNAVQDQYIRATGILGDDLDETTLNAVLGLNQTASHAAGAKVRRGKAIIAATESRTNVAYGTLTTPDQVSNVVLPTDGLIVIAYQATWQESVAGAARAAIFIGANQLKRSGATGGVANVVEASLSGSGSGVDESLSSLPYGLGSQTSEAGGGYAGEATTGQAVTVGNNGGVCYVFAAAGTYTVSVQFKSTSGSVTVKTRKLWVRAESFT